MKSIACFGLLASTLLFAAAAPAAGSSSSPRLDAEPLWLPAGESALATVASGSSVPAGRFVLSLGSTFRSRPVVLRAPSPSAEGREVKALRWALDGAMALAFGIGGGLEFSAVTPVGLSRSGAGIKGVTAQSAEPLANVAVMDPRFGVGYALLDDPALRAKARFELKLPLGDELALAGDDGAVAQGSLALSLGRGDGLFAGADVGLRLRAVSEFFGARVGSAFVATGGVGYALAEPGLRWSLEGYVQPSLVTAGRTGYTPAELLAACAFQPGHGSFDLVAAVGTGLPLSGTDQANTSAASHVAAVGVPALRALLQVRYSQR